MIRDFVIASLSLCVLVLLASVLHLDRFKPAPISVAWFALFGLGALIFAVALGRIARQQPIIRSVARA